MQAGGGGRGRAQGRQQAQEGAAICLGAHSVQPAGGGKGEGEILAGVWGGESVLPRGPGLGSWEGMGVSDRTGRAL